MAGRKKLISAKDVVTKCGVSYSLLNYYTNLGLFDVKKRNGNTRYYDGKEIKGMWAKINRLTDSGYPLRIIRKLLKVA